MKVHSRDVYDLAYNFNSESGELVIVSVGGDNCLKISKVNCLFDDNCKIVVEKMIQNDG